MKTILTTITSILIMVQLSFGQGEKPININDNPKVEVKQNAEKIDLIVVDIYENYTLVGLKFLQVQAIMENQCH